PWDDDMDITMTRKHWNKFLEVCNNGALPKNRALECQQNNRGYHNMVARYTDTTTTALHKTQLMHDDIAGFVIDILVYDALPNTGEALEKYTRDLMLYSDLLNESLIYSYRYRINAFRYLKCRLMMRIKGKDYVLNKLEQEMSKYDEDQCDYLVLHWGGIPLVFDKKTFGESRVNIPIDGTMGQCPDRPFDYLVDHYGDEWMFIPPVTEQQSHEAVFNTEIPFPVIRGEIYHFVSQKKVKRKYRIRKNITITHMNRWQDLKDMGNKINVIAQNLEFSQSLRDRYDEIKKCKEEKNYPALREIFDDIVNIQNARNIAGRGDYSGAHRYFHPILMDIPKEMFELMLETLFNTGSISVAKRFIEIYEYNKGEKTPFMAELEEDILKFRKAVSHFAAKECEESLPLIQELSQKYPKSVPILKLKLSFLSKETDFNESAEEIKSLAERGLSLYPEDGDFIKFLLDTQLSQNREETLLSYIDAWYKTYNGLIKLDIMDIIEENLSFYLEHCQSLAKGKKGDEAFDLITKLEEILQDNVDVYDCKFLVMKEIANNAHAPAKKAKLQFELVQSILSLRDKYINKFRKNEFSEIENL
ncbi:MAG: LicD family protein, partial [Ruminococcus sp.]